MNYSNKNKIVKRIIVVCLIAIGLVYFICKDIKNRIRYRIRYKIKYRNRRRKKKKKH